MRRGRPLKPTISIESLTAALKTLDFSAQSSAESQVLENLSLIDYRLQNAARPSAEDMRAWMLRQILTELMTRTLNQHRSYFKLSPASSNQSRDITARQLTQDFQTDSDHLKGWSLLYLRYVRPELNFSMQDLETITHTTSRTLQRYQEKVIRALRDMLIELEWDVRKNQQFLYLRSNIPEQIVPLLGRDNAFKSILSCFNQDLPRPVMISGAHGIGKSALAASIADYLIKQQEIDYLLWLKQPEQISFIPNRIWDMVLPYSTQAHWRDVLDHQRLLVVIDGVDLLDLGSDEWSELMVDLRQAFVIIINVKKLVFQHQIQHIELENLSQVEIEELIATYTQWNDTQIQTFAKNIIGNPQQIIRATQIATSTMTASVSLKNYYHDSFEALSTMEQVLQVFRIINRGELSDDVVKFILNKHEEQTSQAHIKFSVSYFEYIQSRYQSDPNLRNLIEEAISLICASIKNDSFFLNIVATEWLNLEKVSRRKLLENIDVSKIPLGDVQRWLYLHDRYFGLESYPPDQSPYLSYLYGVALRRTHAYLKARKHLEHLISIFGKSGQFEFQLHCLFELGLLDQAQGALGEAKEIYGHLKQLLETYPLADLEENVSIQLARIAIDQQKGELALEYLQGLDTQANKVYVLFCEAHFLLANFDFLFASIAPYLQQRKMPDNIRASLHTILGRSYQQRARYSEATLQFNEALTLAERETNQFDIARARNNLGTSYLMTLDEQPRELLRELETLLVDTREIQAEIKDTLGYEASTRNLGLLRQYMLKRN